MAKYTNINLNQDILNRPNIDTLLNKVKSLKGVRLKNKIDFRYLNKIDKLENTIKEVKNEINIKRWFNYTIK